MVAPAATVPVTGTFNVGLRRSASVITPDLPLWVVIRNSTESLSFKNYQRYIDIVLCDAPADKSGRWRPDENDVLAPRRIPGSQEAPLPAVHRRRRVPAAQGRNRSVPDGQLRRRPHQLSPVRSRTISTILISRTGVDRSRAWIASKRLWKSYLERVNGTQLTSRCPTWRSSRSKFPDARIKNRIFAAIPGRCRHRRAVLWASCGQKLTEPCLLELIWSYWHEEGMLVQTMNAISLRFQNRRGAQRRSAGQHGNRSRCGH